MLITDPVYEFTLSKEGDTFFSFHFRPGQTWTINNNGTLQQETETFSAEQLITFTEEAVRFSLGPKPNLTELGSHCYLFPNGAVLRVIHETQDQLCLDMFLPVLEFKALKDFPRA